MSFDSVELMQEAIKLGYEELELIQSGDDSENIVLLARKRHELIQRAWEYKKKNQADKLQEQFLVMSKIQELLIEAATNTVEQLRSDIKVVKQEGARMSGYHYSLKKHSNSDGFIRQG
ncbi:hypothetical protein [Desulfovibrio litoralis]|uniref:Protein FliT n=1 Tax=Desulfovibrio litoralis DSM 11393 TaxID=1121455 RepID=A0A1M7TIK1_9BACT|nr:hypothetical protein [Desulfovibrio litoralis]SHN70463.1 hypothetical protein SAMN02745728_02047 [Desulfovibrio litoralis DSM 11393]